MTVGAEGGSPHIEDASQTDASEAAETPETPLVAPAVPEGEEAAPAAEDEGAEELSEETPDEADDRNPAWDDETYAYIKELRNENAKYRTERNRFRDAFEGFEDEEVSAFLEAVRTIPSNPREAHEVFSGLVAALAEAAGITEEEAGEIVTELQDEEDDDAPLTRKELDKYLDEKKESEKKAESDKEALDALNRDVEALGYKVKSEDPDERAEYLALLQEAAENQNGDLEAADAALKDRDQRKIDAFLKAQEKAAQDVPPQTDGAAPSAPATEKPKSIKEAARRAKKEFDARFADNGDAE